METNFKRKEYRNPKLLKWMHGNTCQVASPYCDNKNTVPAHSNSSAFGKGKGQKADDCACAIACQSCHDWIDGRNGRAHEGNDEREWYLNRAIIRTIRLALVEGIIK